MDRRLLAALLVAAAFSVPQPVRADGFCHSITSGSCFNFGGFGGSWGSGSGYGSLQNLIRDVIQRIDWDRIEDLIDEWKDNYQPHDPPPHDPPTSVPEPASALLIATGAVGLGYTRWRRRD
jgi:hypothetical protein